jgi:gamma-glutamyl:cysteine ligase YbdK (ATP-grasp superfamily)
MLNLQEVKEAVDHFSPEELRELREYLETRTGELLSQQQLSPQERIRRMDEAARAIREGFTEAEWEAVEQSMNEEYIEPRPDMLRNEIDTLLAAAQPTPLKAGTMDTDQLLQAVHNMWDGLGERDIDTVVQAMNQKR